MQAAGVQACAKHYLGNEQEKNRETMSSNIADRVNHELYLWYVHNSSFPVQNPNVIGPLRMQSKPTSLL